MKRFLSLLMVAVLAGVVSARAQLAVNLKPSQDTYLVYESIPVTVTVHNYSSRTIELVGTEEQPWLRFTVTNESGGLVDAAGKKITGGQTLIEPGQTVSHTVDLLPLYDLRGRGNYRVQAQLNFGGIATASRPVAFTIINGRDLTQATVGIPGGEPGVDEYRTYGLVARLSRDAQLLYVRVRDDTRQMVYSLVPLGQFIPTEEPTLQVDRKGLAHVMFQNGPRAYAYVCISPAGTMVSQAVYSDMLSKPALVSDKGVVSVQGGEKIFPKSERMLTAEELQPPPPPPPPPKKKWWWPFGGGSSKTNPPAARPPESAGRS